MRIAIYHNLPSGGAKRALRELVTQMTASHRVDVYTLSSAIHDFADLRPYVAQHKVYDFHASTLLSSPWGRFNQALRIGDLLRLRQLSKTIATDIQREEYDLAFVHGCQFEKAPAVLRHIQTLPKAYYCQEALRHFHEPMPFRPYQSHTGMRAAVDRVDPLPALYCGIHSYMDRDNIQSADTVLVNSKYSRSEIFRIYEIDAQVSHLGVDETWFRPHEVERENFVLSVGSLTPLKGFDFLIKSLATIPAKQRPPLVIASNFQNPAEHAYLAGLAADANVEIKLVGNISDEELVGLYNRARMTLYTPIREPFGLVAIESMACGTPVVAVCEGGIQETVIHEETGLLTERDPEQFGASVQRLLSDSTLATKMGRNGRECVENYWTWEHAFQRLEGLLTAHPKLARMRSQIDQPEFVL